MAGRDQPEGVPAAAVGTGRITPADIQEKVFKQAFRGYSEREVDEFLDRVTEELARLYTENKRLREQLAARPAAAPTPQAAPPPPAAAGGPGAEQAALGALAAEFVRREREFLQALASQIQTHAEAVKQDVRRARESTRASRGTPAAPTAAPTPAPAPAPAAAPPAAPVSPPPVAPAPAPVPPAPETLAPTPFAPPALPTAPVGAPPPMVAPAPGGPGPLRIPDAPAPSSPWDEPRASAEMGTRVDGSAVAGSPAVRTGTAVGVEDLPGLIDLTTIEGSPKVEEETQLLPVASFDAGPAAPDIRGLIERAAGHEEGAEPPRSIRELFWGEE